MTLNRTTATMIAVLILTGCEREESRLATMADQYARQQADQNRQLVGLQREVAQGARDLVEADAKSRVELAALQRELGQQQAQLESDRRDLAAQRRWDPVVAAAITTVGMTLACLLPLLICLLLLKGDSSADAEGDVGQLLIEDFASTEPFLLPPPGDPRDGDDREAATSPLRLPNGT